MCNKDACDKTMNVQSCRNTDKTTKFATCGAALVIFECLLLVTERLTKLLGEVAVCLVRCCDVREASFVRLPGEVPVEGGVLVVLLIFRFDLLVPIGETHYAGVVVKRHYLRVVVERHYGAGADKSSGSQRKSSYSAKTKFLYISSNFKFCTYGTQTCKVSDYMNRP